MKIVKVNQDLCIGCGLCVGIAEAIFSLQNGVSKVVTNGKINTSNEGIMNAAMNSCPVGAIYLEDK